MSCFLVILFFHLKLASSYINHGEFSFESFDGVINLRGDAELDTNGLLTLTNVATVREIGQLFYNLPVQFKNSTNSSVVSFSTTFMFAMVPEYPKVGGHGLAFVISPCKGIGGAYPSKYLGLFNALNEGNSSNHIVAIELDTVQDLEFNDINDNHVGIDINGLQSISSFPAGYYTDNIGGFNELNLNSEDPMQVWIEYNGLEKQLNVTLYPITIPKPDVPLLSLSLDLSPYLYESMYVGFSSSTGILSSSHYILGWSFKLNGQAQELDLSRLPKFPWSTTEKEGYQKLQKILAVVLSLVGVIILLLLVFGAVLISWKRKFNEVLEDWEVQYGPQRFTYKNLHIATKGFKERELLGKGGFGRVYRGVLPVSHVQIAVKRISHDSRQGMREFVAEIATIGRLRHQNLVRLLGYCRRKHELFLVYDYLPNGSLDKFLHGQSCVTLSWTQRFKIIKDVASALFYLHQQWVQVVIHRDIKPANVLIDNDMNARLGDFGLAKLCDHGIDPQTSHVAGTLGYIAPELVRSGKANTSTDLYAFGTFMLEVACGRRPIEPRASPDEIILVDWVMDCWDRGAILESVDRRLGSEYVIEEVELVLKLGLFCSHAVAAARPSMSSVVQLLDGVAQLPDNLIATIKARDFDVDSNEKGASLDVPTERTSIPPLTFTESFRSRGR